MLLQANDVEDVHMKFPPRVTRSAKPNFNPAAVLHEKTIDQAAQVCSDMARLEQCKRRAAGRGEGGQF